MFIGVDIRCLMNSNRTGVGEYTYQLLNAIFAIDKTNQYFLFYNSSKDVSKNIPKWEQDNARYVGLKWPNKLLNLLLFLKFVKLENLVIEKLFENCKLKIENLNVWFSPNLNFTSLKKHTKHILTMHDLSFEFMPECFTLKHRLWHWFLRPRKQCQRADLILAPSENTARDVIESYKVESYKVIKLCPGVSQPVSSDQLSVIKNKYGLSENFILYLGTLEPRKNVSVLIEAYKKLTNLHTYKLIIVGDKGWRSESVMRLIENTPGVQYVGYVDAAKKAELYQNASLFVFPSLYEGFGLPVLEAMAMGVPVITSNRSSLPEIASEKVRLVNPHNLFELKNAMVDNFRKKEENHFVVEDFAKFNWEEMAKDFLEMLSV